MLNFELILTNRGDAIPVQRLLKTAHKSFPCQVMRTRQDRMPVKHAWAGIFHCCPDLFPHIRFVTVYSAFGALRFVLLEGALFKALHNVVQKLPALGTEAFFITMLSMAEDLNHRLSCSAFQLHF